MVSKIIWIIINLISFILKLIINIITIFIPDFGMSELNTGITAFFALLDNAVNMTYFLIGPGMYIMIDMIAIYWVTEHIGAPIIITLRKIFVKD